MKLPEHSASFFGPWVRGLAVTFVALLVGVSPPPLTSATKPSPTESENLFERTNLLRLSIIIDEAGMQTLHRSQAARSLAIKPKAQSKVIEGGRVYTNVTVQLKGFSSFQPIDGQPGLTLNFGKLAPKQRFHGLSKISLNNSVQDRTLLHEKLSRELFAAAGVPVPRSDYAVVTLNGRALGLYVLVEGYDQDFLKRHFKRTDGNLYDGGVLQDIDRPLRLSSGKNATDHSGIQKLLRATRVSEPAERFRALEAALDMDRFLSMVAMEAILCHSDSYSMNRNNYRLYHDPSTDKIVFMPHGMDRVLGTHRSGLDLSIVPPTLGLVARATLSTSDGRRRYLERAGPLFTNLFQPDRLSCRVREIADRINNDFHARAPERRYEWGGRQIRAQDVENLCQRIWARATDLKEQLAQFSEIVVLPPSPKFDSNGTAPLGRWKPIRKLGQPEVSCEIETRDGKELFHLKTTNSRVIASLRCVVSLPSGRYWLNGPVKLIGPDGGGVGDALSLALLRYSSSRFGAELQHLNWKEVDCPIQVAEARAPEEIEMICTIRAASPEVWFDPTALRLTRATR